MFDCIIIIQMNYKCSQVSPFLKHHNAPFTAIHCLLACLLHHYWTITMLPSAPALSSSSGSCRTVIHSINEFPRLANNCVPSSPRLLSSSPYTSFHPAQSLSQSFTHSLLTSNFVLAIALNMAISRMSHNRQYTQYRPSRHQYHSSSGGGGGFVPD